MKTHILVIEDDLSLRVLLEESLTQWGYQVDLAPDGREGLRRLAEGTYDLILLDLCMPVTSGFEVLDELKKLALSTPIVITSGIVVPEIHNYLKIHRRVTLLSKPYTREELLQSIEDILEDPGVQMTGYSDR